MMEDTSLKRKNVSDDEKDDEKDEKKIKVGRERVTVSIIGSAGRKYDGPRMSSKLYKRMMDRAKSIIINDFKLDWNDVILVSGGSAFADHLVVSLYQELSKQFDSLSLTLYLPCKWNGDQFQDTKSKNFKENPGQYLNYLHNQFSKRVKINSLKDLEIMSQDKKVTIDTSRKGFHARNLLVAKSNYLIAFAFGGGKAKEPAADGGTFHTWSNCDSEDKVFVDLDLLDG